VADGFESVMAVPSLSWLGRIGCGDPRAVFGRLPKAGLSLKYHG
jgi:hypothetical protein